MLVVLGTAGTGNRTGNRKCDKSSQRANLTDSNEATNGLGKIERQTAELPAKIHSHFAQQNS